MSRGIGEIAAGLGSALEVWYELSSRRFQQGSGPESGVVAGGPKASSQLSRVHRSSTAQVQHERQAAGYNKGAVLKKINLAICSSGACSLSGLSVRSKGAMAQQENILLQRRTTTHVTMSQVSPPAPDASALFACAACTRTMQAEARAACNNIHVKI